MSQIEVERQQFLRRIEQANATFNQQDVSVLSHVEELPKSPFANFIQFMNSTMGGNSFQEGAKYAEMLIGFSNTDLPNNISQEIIRRTIPEMQQIARRDRLDIVDIIEKKRGDELLRSIIPQYSVKNPELSEYFKDNLEDPLMKLGAFTVLHMKEREQERLRDLENTLPNPP